MRVPSLRIHVLNGATALAVVLTVHYGRTRPELAIVSRAVTLLWLPKPAFFR